MWLLLPAVCGGSQKEMKPNQIGEDLGRSRTQPRGPDGGELTPRLLGSQHQTCGGNDTFLSIREQNQASTAAVATDGVSQQLQRGEETMSSSSI